MVLFGNLNAPSRRVFWLFFFCGSFLVYRPKGINVLQISPLVFLFPLQSISFFLFFLFFWQTDKAVSAEQTRALNLMWSLKAAPAQTLVLSLLLFDHIVCRVTDVASCEERHWCTSIWRFDDDDGTSLDVNAWLLMLQTPLTLKKKKLYISPEPHGVGSAAASQTLVFTRERRAERFGLSAQIPLSLTFFFFSVHSHETSSILHKTRGAM